MAFHNLKLIKTMGCPAIHIGGGEPFLDPDGLIQVLKAAMNIGVRVDYIETNSSWFKDLNSAREILALVRSYGVRQLLISISPFHNEHTPLIKVNGVMQACLDVGINGVPWTQFFYPELSQLGATRTHSLEEMISKYGQRYPQSIAQRFWIQPLGRAPNFLSQVYTPASSINLATNRIGCNELMQTNHFHLDLYGNYIPGLCAGLAIRSQDLGKPLSETRYPIISRLFESGIGGLIDYARKEFGFSIGHEYLSKCHLCQEIRKFLVVEKGYQSQELQPVEFYYHI